jgi:hypothetical protein
MPSGLTDAAHPPAPEHILPAQAWCRRGDLNPHPVARTRPSICRAASRLSPGIQETPCNLGVFSLGVHQVHPVSTLYAEVRLAIG